MRTKALTQIAITVAAMVVGGFAIYLLSSQWPFPGLKYVFMTPYLSMIIALVLLNFKMRHSVFLVNTVFAMVMVLIHPLMGLAIFATGVFTDALDQLASHTPWRVAITASAYAAFTMASALLVSKWFIGDGAFAVIDGPYIVILTAIGSVMGFFGCQAGLLIGRRVKEIRGQI